MEGERERVTRIFRERKKLKFQVGQAANESRDPQNFSESNCILIFRHQDTTSVRECVFCVGVVPRSCRVVFGTTNDKVITLVAGNPFVCPLLRRICSRTFSVRLCLFPSVLRPSITFFPTILSFSVPFCPIRVCVMFPSFPSHPFSLPH